VAKEQILIEIDPTQRDVIQILWRENFWGAKAVCFVVETPAEGREALPNAAHVVLSLFVTPFDSLHSHSHFPTNHKICSAPKSLQSFPRASLCLSPDYHPH
jgi:hypothetical protein